MKKDTLIIGKHEFNSRFILGSGKYSLNLIESAIKDAGAEIITLAVRRANTKEQENILRFYKEPDKSVCVCLLSRDIELFSNLLTVFLSRHF